MHDTSKKIKNKVIIIPYVHQQIALTSGTKLLINGIWNFAIVGMLSFFYIPLYFSFFVVVFFVRQSYRTNTVLNILHAKYHNTT